MPEGEGMSTASIITENRTIDSFSGIKFTGIGHVYITQSEKTSLEIKAPTAMIQRIKSEVKNDILELGYKFAMFRWLRSAGELKKIEFHISSPSFSSIISTGAGVIAGTNTINEKDMTIKSTGAGNMEIDIEANTVLAKVTGAGSVTIQGNVNAQDVTITGAGKYEGFNLISNTAVIHSTGSGQTFVTVNKKLDVKITGVGTVKYKGEPAIESNITGLGKLESGN